jgi:hypothetical protein
MVVQDWVATYLMDNLLTAPFSISQSVNPEWVLPFCQQRAPCSIFVSITVGFRQTLALEIKNIFKPASGSIGRCMLTV